MNFIRGRLFHKPRSNLVVNVMYNVSCVGINHTIEPHRQKE